MKDKKWRFLNTGFGDAFFNMALDEVILDLIREGKSPPTLRVYGWSPPAISFGYAQRIKREVDLEECRRVGVDLVRRVTGGRAVLHWDELTYSVICRGDDPLIGGDISQTYRTISRCLIAGLETLGVEAQLEKSETPTFKPRGGEASSPCFSSTARYEVTVQGKKLLGSAQRRVKDMILQHGSLLMGPAHKRIVDLMRSGSDEMKAQFQRELDSGTISLKEILPQGIDFDELGEVLRRGFESCLKVEMVCANPSEDERRRAKFLAREKYGTDEWNLRGGNCGL